MKLKKFHWLGIVFGVIAIIVSAVFFNINRNLFYFILGLGIIIVVFPFVFSSVIESKEEREKDDMFLEFSRNLVESVKSGTPISKSIINLRAKEFGSLSPHIQKLANQISIGIPVSTALETFAYDTKSITILRSITLLREAEKAGGNISDILESVASSVAETEKLKKERRAAIYSIVVQGYIIFLIFIIIMLVMEFGLLPQMTQISEIGGTPEAGAGLEELELPFGTLGGGVDVELLSLSFLALLVTQGFFAGLIIGKLAEGNIKAGLKHSFILVALALVISTGSKIIF